ncbi:hypothetical protein C8Q76DRAFT_160808 [Earliella scabrosa]|nr:hypothetical protein C8Q76DRAFT_160808 [Earliella scabrosa]
MGIPTRLPLSDRTVLSVNCVAPSDTTQVGDENADKYLRSQHDSLPGGTPPTLQTASTEPQLYVSTEAYHSDASSLRLEGLPRIDLAERSTSIQTTSNVESTSYTLEPSTTSATQSNPPATVSATWSDDNDVELRAFEYDPREEEIRMVLKYLVDLEEGGPEKWHSTRTQGLPPKHKRQARPLDEAPSRNRPIQVPLCYLLRKIRFASAINRTCEAVGSDDSPFPDCTFVFRSEATVSYGVSRLDHGSLHDLRALHEQVFYSRLLPLHPYH